MQRYCMIATGHAHGSYVTLGECQRNAHLDNDPTQRQVEDNNT